MERRSGGVSQLLDTFPVKGQSFFTELDHGSGRLPVGAFRLVQQVSASLNAFGKMNFAIDLAQEAVPAFILEMLAIVIVVQESRLNGVGTEGGVIGLTNIIQQCQIKEIFIRKRDQIGVKPVFSRNSRQSAMMSITEWSNESVFVIYRHIPVVKLMVQKQ